MTSADYRTLLATTNPHAHLQEDDFLPGLEATQTRPPEIELQSRWFAGEFGRSFHTTTGQRLEIIQIGTWNHAAGPDFSQVAVRIGGRQLTGFLELDWEARDWERHGHAQNPAYDDVILHVFFEQPPGTFFTRTSEHREVAQVRIDLAGFPQVGPAPAPAEARCGRCSFPLQDHPPSLVERLFEAAARQRLERKAARLARLAALHGWDQALFQELAAALGYRRNQWPMTLLTQRLPLRTLIAHPAGPEALLFGGAGFLETKVFETAPPDTREYLRQLWAQWWKYRDDFCGLQPPRWALAGARPQNHPHRRLGALAHLVSQWKKVRAGFDPPAREHATPAAKLTEALAALTHPYWDRHYTLASQATTKPVALVGSSRIADVLANVAFPRFSLRPELAGHAWQTYASLPAALNNEKSRRAAQRLLGRRPDAASLQKKLIQQQALLQIYTDFCLKDSSDCAACLFPEQLAQWPHLTLSQQPPVPRAP